MSKHVGAGIVLSALILSAPAAAFEYEVEGSQPLRVIADDELLTAGVVAATAGYALPVVVSAIALGFAISQGETRTRNKGTQLLFATPPVINGALVGMHLLDEMEASDAREGWAALPAMLMWGATAGQVVGLSLVTAAFMLASREPLLEGP